MIFYHFETGMFGFIDPKNDTCLSRWPGYDKMIYKTSAQGVTYRQVLTGGICNTSSISNSHGLPRSCTLIVSHRLLTSPTQLSNRHTASLIRNSINPYLAYIVHLCWTHRFYVNWVQPGESILIMHRFYVNWAQPAIYSNNSITSSYHRLRDIHQIKKRVL